MVWDVVLPVGDDDAAQLPGQFQCEMSWWHFPQDLLPRPDLVRLELTRHTGRIQAVSTTIHHYKVLHATSIMLMDVQAAKVYLCGLITSTSSSFR